MPGKLHHLHLISDSTGETLHAMVRAALAPFGVEGVELHVSVFVRSERDLDRALALVAEKPGMILYTLTDPARRAQVNAAAGRLGVVSHAALDGLSAALAEVFERSPQSRPGAQHRMGDDYFRRIAALDYAIAHDDGSLGRRLAQADVILTGASRTSKTPTCIYLAYRGVKAANVPLVPGRPAPGEFLDALARGIPTIGLVASPSRLSQIRAQRLEALGTDKNPNYADLDAIRDEVAETRLFFARHDLPVIDVTRRSIEETAAEILAILRDRGAVEPA